MTDITNIYDAAGLRIFQTFGIASVFYPATGDPIDCLAIVESATDLQPSGETAQAWGPQTTVEVLSAQLLREPNRGEYFIVGAQTWHVVEITSNDGVFIKCAVK